MFVCFLFVNVKYSKQLVSIMSRVLFSFKLTTCKVWSGKSQVSTEPKFERKEKKRRVQKNLQRKTDHQANTDLYAYIYKHISAFIYKHAHTLTLTLIHIRTRTHTYIHTYAHNRDV
jgi:hypothetical protein